MSLCLLADVPPAGDARTAVLVVVGGILGGAVQWLWVQVREVWRERKGEKSAAQKTITDHLESVVARLDRENKELEGRHDVLQKRVERSEVRGARLEGHVRYIEAVLKANNIAFVPWAEPPDVPGSDVHRALPPQEPHQ